MAPDVMKRSDCRICGHSLLIRILSLGNTPLANAFLTADQRTQKELTYPLDIDWCPRCSLVQLLEVVPADELFTQYIYFSSTSDTVRHHAQTLAESMSRRFALTAASQVVEVASNDGCVLKAFQQRNIKVLGIEPARNIAEKAIHEGIDTWVDFFTPAIAKRLNDQKRSADLLISRHVLGHVDDLPGFAHAAALSLKDNGVWVIEVPYLVDLLEKTEFDTIYHEHLSYFSVHALNHLMQASGLSIFDIERIPLHGGAILVYVQLRNGKHSITERVGELLQKEKSLGLLELKPYEAFAQRVAAVRRELPDLLNKLTLQGLKLAGYGAPAKGNTLLNTCGITDKQVAFLADRSPYKQGLYAPGSHIPVVAPEEIASRKPDVLLLLAWNFADEVYRQQESFWKAGGRFVVPIPTPHLVGKKELES